MMRDVFRFWGFSRALYDHVVNDHRILGVADGSQARALFGRVHAQAELLEHSGPLVDLCAPGWFTWLALDTQDQPHGEPLAWLRTDDGTAYPIVTRNERGGFRFWFDVDRTIRFIENEEYCRHRKPWYVSLGINPDRLPGWMRHLALRTLQRLAGRRRSGDPSFPAHPFDPAADIWRHMLRSLVQKHTDARVIPFWPDGKQYAVILNHDIDTSYCFRRPAVLHAFRDAEEGLGLRSAWMVVTKLLPAGRSALDKLFEAGHEIGFHDTRHDHQLAFLPVPQIQQRFDEAEELKRRYFATGFRSPNYLRTPALYDTLNGRWQYDMSMHPVVPAGSGSAGEGCSTSFPFFIGHTDVLEIPTTVPEDVLLELNGCDPDEALRRQVAAIEHIRRRGGVANILTHPEPLLSARPEWIEVYRRLLAFVVRDPAAWIVRPGDLNRHWRTRQAQITRHWQDAPLLSEGVEPRRHSLQFGTSFSGVS